MTLHARLMYLCSLAWSTLATPRAANWAMRLVPLMFALLSLRLGQDDNWDLKNYHLYNPFAFLHGKIGVDLAPAQWQSYFNPTLDLLYYALVTTLPGPAAGAIMGLLHGLNFVLLLLIGRAVVPPDDSAAARRQALLLAVAGTLGAAFLTQLGNSMGDNMTSLFTLGALLLLLQRWDVLGASGSAGLLAASLAGLCMGLGCGLKLTNAVYALGLCLALASVQSAPGRRLMLMLVFGIGVVAGLAVTAGHWFVLMYQTFGNPLFPQFNNYFHAPLAASIGIGDTGWLPKDLTEKVLWPLIFALNPRRVGELSLRLWLWPVLYLGLMLCLIKRVGTRLPEAATPVVQRQRLLLWFFVLSYFAWLNMFGIFRYLVPLELLLPLLLWLVVGWLLPRPFAARVAAALLVVGTIAGLPHVSWGHGGWARTAFYAEVPHFEQPADNLVLTVHGDPPMGWLVTQFPVALTFASLGSGFPESPAYVSRVRAMATARKGPVYVMLQADRAAADAHRSAAELQQAAVANQDTIRKAAGVLQRYGFTLDPASCQSHPALVGRSRWNYQLCVVGMRAPP